MRKYIAILFLAVSLSATSQIVKTAPWHFIDSLVAIGQLQIPSGASSGFVLTSDSRGMATWQASGASVLNSATVTLDSSKVRLLHTVPDTIIPAQGANTIIVVTSIFYSLEYNTVPYSAATGTTLQIILGGSTINNNNNFLGYSSNAVYGINSSGYGGQSGSITTANAPLTLTVGSSNPSVGNSSLKVTVLYYVVNL